MELPATRLYFMSFKTQLIILAVFLIFSQTSAALEAPFLSDRLSISGFGTVAATNAGDDELGYYREFTNHDQTKNWALTTDSLLGAQFDMHISSNLDASLQLVAKDRANNGLEESIEWAYLKYQPASDWRVRAGRMGLDLYMLSEYRNVGFAYLWVRPVTEFYTPVVFTHFDGLDISYNQQMKSGFIQLKLFAGQSSVDVDAGDDYFTLDVEDLIGVNVLYETLTWKTRATIATAKVEDVKNSPVAPLQTALSSVPGLLWPDAASIVDDLEPVGKRLTYYSIGAAYDKGWQIQSELAYIDSDWDFFPSLYSAYVSVGKRFGEFTPYIVASRIKMADDHYEVSSVPPGFGLEPLQTLTQASLDQVRMDQQTFSLGVRWDAMPQLAFKAQWDYTRINDQAGALWAQNEFPISDRYQNVFTISMDFLF